ncbi:hypothetical protein ABFX02_08G078600 [Erythranthe guttata]
MMPSRSTNGETSSAGNMQMNRHNLKRKSIDSTNCHQCHRNDKEKVVRCTKCKHRGYCILCINKWYRGLQEADFAEACAGCRKICNCTACIHSDLENKDLFKPDLQLDINKKVQYSKYIIRVLLPSFRKFVVEQNIEREEEARIQGVSVAGLQLPKANFIHDDKVKCDNCKTAIFDIHRSCLNCMYKLCVTCCREMRNGFQWGNDKYHVHHGGRTFTSNDRFSAAACCSMDHTSFTSEWKLIDRSTIVCPPEIMGGCAHGNLVLKSTYPDNWVSELLIKAESIDLEVGEVSEEACSCSGTAVRNIRCPKVVGVDQKHFQRHLYKGEPVIVPDVLSRTTGLSWEPLVMWRGCRKSRRTDDARILEFSVTNCVNWCKETINMHQFFNGYSEGLLDSEGRPKILKLEDWPPTESFQERLPRHFVEFIRCLPFKLYTHEAGYLNMPAKTPKKSLKPDLGQKICFAYGVNEDLGFCSATKLQYAVSDMVNVLMHTAETSLNPEELSTVVELGRKHIAQDPLVFRVSNGKANQDATRNQQFERENKNKGKEKVDPSTSENNDPSFDEQKCGAIWDIFRRQDVPKLEDYLRRHYGEFRRVVPLQQLVHPIHEKAFYLTMEHKRKLKDEYGIEPWTFVQRLGDAVLVPAGCPYQARNLKSCTSMSIDFVSAESVGQCIRLSTEYRRLPKNHSCKEDKLQVKGLVLSAVCQAVQYLDKIDAMTLRSPFAPPFEHGNVRHNPAQQGERPSILQMRRELERMKLALVTKGHLFQPHMKDYLLKEITLLTNKINSSAGSSSS